jgi:stage II sporulation protein D
MILCAALPAMAQNVTVRLFEIFHPQRITISSDAQPNQALVCVGNDTIFRTSQKFHVALTNTSLQIESAGVKHALRLADTVTAIASGALLVGETSPRTTEKAMIAGNLRPYSGRLKIYVSSGELCLLNFLPMNDYLGGILVAELPQAELSALQAQAIVSRAYIFGNWQRHQEVGYQFCDLTHCQTFKGIAGVNAKIHQAVTSTEGERLTFNNQAVEAFYHSTCGGLTADDAGVWGNDGDKPYLKSFPDSKNHSTFCAESPHFRWRLRVRADSLHQLWQSRLSEPITSIAVTKRGADGRVREIALIGNTLHVISGEDFRTVVCRALGWNTIKSTAFELTAEKNFYLFAGNGLGHGLGLCQFGAMQMAREGYSYREILQHYFPGTAIQKKF